MTMTEIKKKYSLAELDQERREIEEEFEGAETIEIIVAPDLKISYITDEEAERLRLPPTADGGADRAPSKRRG